MRYPKKQPFCCTVTTYPNGSTYCHNTQQKLGPGSCRDCIAHFKADKRPLTWVRSSDDSLITEPPEEILSTFKHRRWTT